MLLKKNPMVRLQFSNYILGGNKLYYTNIYVNLSPRTLHKVRPGIGSGAGAIKKMSGSTTPNGTFESNPI